MKLSLRLISLVILALSFLIGFGSALVQSKAYRYVHLDVFTDAVLTGNQLAVFLEPAGLTPELMLAITREMAFSETTFVFPAEDEGTDFRVRIFGNNLNRELKVAGHPTIGTAFALAHQGRIKPGTKRVVFGLGIGPTPLELQWREDQLEFAWMHQLQPTFGKAIDDIEAVASALGVRAEEIRSTGLPVQQVSCGAPFLMVPLASRDAVDRSQLNRAAMGELLERLDMVRRGIYVFSRESADDDATVYSRMFGFGVVEDPATGNASGPIGSYLVHHQVIPPEEAQHIACRQGVKMGRPSWVHVRVHTEGKKITGVLVGGGSVVVGEGTVNVGTP